MTTDPRTWSLDELRDWIALDDKWERLKDFDDTPLWGRDKWTQEDHPIPATLDAIAGALPSGWEWDRGRSWSETNESSHLYWSATGKIGGRLVDVEVNDTGDEKLDRARLAVLARIAMKEKQ